MINTLLDIIIPPPKTETMDEVIVFIILIVTGILLTVFINKKCIS